MAMDRKQFLEMTAKKVLRASSRQDVADLVNQFDPTAEIRIRCADGHTYEWLQAGENLFYEADIGDEVLLQDIELNNFDELRLFAVSHILSLK